MAGLVGYASSDDESETETSVVQQSQSTKEEGAQVTISNDVKTTTSPSKPEREAKETPPKTAEKAGDAVKEAKSARSPPRPEKKPESPERPERPERRANPAKEETQSDVPIGPSRPPPGVSLGFSDEGNGSHLPMLDDEDDNDHQSHPDVPPLSPYSRERAQVRAMTMPRMPDFAITASPPGTPPPTLEALNQKVDTFLTLKRNKGTHFNARLVQSSAMQNPALMDKLLEFVGLGATEEDSSKLRKRKAVDSKDGKDGKDERDDMDLDSDNNNNNNNNTTTEPPPALAAQYATTLPTNLWDPAALPAWAYRTRLRKAQEDMARQRARAPGEKVQFVSASATATTTGASSTAAGGLRPGGLPKEAAPRRKTRFD